jgi:hypothetical protein
MLSFEEEQFWIDRAGKEATEATNVALRKLNHELQIEGFCMELNIHIGVSFHPVPSGEVDRRFLLRCGIQPEWEVTDEIHRY